MPDKEMFATKGIDKRHHLGYATVTYSMKDSTIVVSRPEMPDAFYIEFIDYKVMHNWLLMRHAGECGTSYVACDLHSSDPNGLLTLEVPSGTYVLDVTEDGVVSCRLGNIEFERLIC